MVSERIQRRVDRLLDQSEEDADADDWGTSAKRAREALNLDAANGDARLLLESAESMLDAQSSPRDTPPAPIEPVRPPSHPSSFVAGRYRVERFLGEGGRKRVFLAHGTTLDRDIAFAQIRTEGLDDLARERVMREAQYMAGGTVASLLGDGTPDVERTLAVAADVCGALSFMHGQGLIHRDLKPANIFLADDGTAKVGDFGLAGSRITQQESLVSTAAYMPPEQALGGEVTPQSDLYALGAMLYEMVTGRPPFVGDDATAVIGQHINTPPVAPYWHSADCPSGLETLILRLLDKDPSRRPSSAEEVL